MAALAGAHIQEENVVKPLVLLVPLMMCAAVMMALQVAIIVCLVLAKIHRIALTTVLMLARLLIGHWLVLFQVRQPPLLAVHVLWQVLLQDVSLELLPLECNGFISLRLMVGCCCEASGITLFSKIRPSP